MDSNPQPQPPQGTQTPAPNPPQSEEKIYDPNGQPDYQYSTLPEVVAFPPPSTAAPTAIIPPSTTPFPHPSAAAIAPPGSYQPPQQQGFVLPFPTPSATPFSQAASSYQASPATPVPYGASPYPPVGSPPPPYDPASAPGQQGQQGIPLQNGPFEHHNQGQQQQGQAPLQGQENVNGTGAATVNGAGLGAVATSPMTQLFPQHTPYQPLGGQAPGPPLPPNSHPPFNGQPPQPFQNAAGQPQPPPGVVFPPGTHPNHQGNPGHPGNMGPDAPSTSNPFRPRNRKKLKLCICICIGVLFFIVAIIVGIAVGVIKKHLDKEEGEKKGDFYRRGAEWEGAEVVQAREVAERGDDYVDVAVKRGDNVHGGRVTISIEDEEPIEERDNVYGGRVNVLIEDTVPVSRGLHADSSSDGTDQERCEAGEEKKAIGCGGEDWCACG